MIKNNRKWKTRVKTVKKVYEFPSLPHAYLFLFQAQQLFLYIQLLSASSQDEP